MPLAEQRAPGRECPFGLFLRLLELPRGGVLIRLLLKSTRLLERKGRGLRARLPFSGARNVPTASATRAVARSPRIIGLSPSPAER